MKQTQINYSDAEQKLVGQLIHSENLNDKAPGIIIYPAFDGPSEFYIHYARQLADEGYVCFVADIYGDGEVAKTLEACFECITPFLEDRSLVRRRALLAFETFKHMTQVDEHNIGAIGFCFGGMCMLEVARSGAALKAGVGAHSALAAADLPKNKITTKLLLMQGFQDPQVPASSLDAFSKEMFEAGNEDWEFIFYGDGQHSFTDPATGTFDAVKEAELGRVYNETLAKRTYQRALNFFHETL